jgi:UDP-glucuronate decarboxylase
MIRMMECDGFIGPVNLGNPVENTILEFAEKIITITGSKSKIIFQPLPQDDPKQRQPDITLAGEKLSWQPAVALADGLISTAAYFAERIRKG